MTTNCVMNILEEHETSCWLLAKNKTNLIGTLGLFLQTIVTIIFNNRFYMQEY